MYQYTTKESWPRSNKTNPEGRVVKAFAVNDRTV